MCKIWLKHQLKTPNNILASSSPRRKELLTQIGYKFSVTSSNINENFNLSLSPKNFAEHWAYEKANCVALKNSDSMVIGADTIVVKDKEIFGKPKKRSDSFSMLKKLSGKTHQVITGVSIIFRKYNLNLTFSDSTLVTFNDYSDGDILKYIDDKQPYDKAGSYGIQDSFAMYIRRINGCYYNVMGLPLSKFHKNYNLILNKKLKSDINS
jgi:septum formation protein|tara:strand:+ start:406 stop:1032 length:627 start_codon:yes stop_codon:yes gene_type:complete